METYEDTFHFRFILVNIFLVIVYIDKVNKSQVNDSEKVNEVNFQQEEIDVPKDVLNQNVKDTELEQITARSKEFLKLCERSFKHANV